MTPVSRLAGRRVASRITPIWYSMSKGSDLGRYPVYTQRDGLRRPSSTALAASCPREWTPSLSKMRAT